MSIIITDDDGNSLVDLTTYVPAFIYGMADPAGFFEAAGYEEMRLRDAVDDLVLQNLPSTATWSMALWAQIYGVTGEDNDAILAAILDKMTSRLTCTPALIKQYALSLTGEEVSIEEDFANYSFTITFIGCLGEPDGIDAFKSRLATIVPAHLTYEIAYSYNSWDDAAAITWEDAAAYTWESIRYSSIGG